MSKAVVDPAELRRFALDLKRFVAAVEAQMGVMNSRMQALGQTWRDQEQAKFAEQFGQRARAVFAPQSGED